MVNFEPDKYVINAKCSLYHERVTKKKPEALTGFKPVTSRPNTGERSNTELKRESC